MRKILLTILSISIVLLSIFFVFFVCYSNPGESFPPSLDGKLIPIEMNRTGDYMVFELKNVTVMISSESDEKYENISLYDAFGNSTIYNVFVIANTTDFNTTWEYQDSDGNAFINEGDRFILYNLSKYEGERNPYVVFEVKGYGGVIEGKMNMSLKEET